MQIFVPYPNPVESAKALDTVRLNKQIVECAQILSTVLYLRGDKGPYKPTHINHPIVRWANQGLAYAWTYKFLEACARDYYYRKGLPHKTGGLTIRLGPPNRTSYIDWTLLLQEHEYHCPIFDNCTPYQYLHVHEAYRNLLNAKWEQDLQYGRTPKWYPHKPPRFAPKSVQRLTPEGAQ